MVHLIILDFDSNNYDDHHWIYYFKAYFQSLRNLNKAFGSRFYSWGIVLWSFGVSQFVCFATNEGNFNEMKRITCSIVGETVQMTRVAPWCINYGGHSNEIIF